MGATKNKVAAVVVTWNRKDMLRKCLDCLVAQEGASCDIIVVDNDSSDGTGDMISEDYSLPQLYYFNTGYNLGGAGGFMCGIETTVKMGYDRVWIMDDDCLPSPSALSELLRADEVLGGEWGFLCSAIYWTDGEICRFNRPKKNVFRHVGEKDYEEDLVPVVMTSFVSVMFRADVVREVGLPIAEYFIWTDDYEYTGRISKRYPSYVVPPSCVTHAMKSNERPSLATIDESGIGRFYFLSRNDVHCYRQHGFFGRVYLVAKAAYTAADVIVHANGIRRKRLAQFAKGTLDGIEFEPEIPKVTDTISKNDDKESSEYYSEVNSDGPNIVILSTQTTRVIPYIKVYEDIIGEKEYDLIYWDRHGYKDGDDFAHRVFRYAYHHESDSDKLHGIGGYLGFARYAKRIIKQNGYSKLILLQAQTGVAIASLLKKKFRGKYILDIRDYSYEGIPLFRYIESHLIHDSYQTVISSEGFKVFLPKHDYVIAHNIPAKSPMKLPKRTVDNRIVITYSGCIHYYNQNIRLINLFANDDRFLFRFVGEGSEVLRPYIESNSIKNISIEGPFTPDKEPEIYATSDVISNAYGNHVPLLDYALANKLYLAVAYRKPLLVSKDTYSAKIATNIGIGFIVDFENPNCKEELIEFIDSFDYETVDKACAEAMANFIEMNNNFIETIKTFVAN